MILGDTLSRRFLLQDEAGSGGMGTVYRALDRETGEFVAVKVLRGAGAGFPGGERFLREAALLEGLRHPGIVRYVAHGRTPLGAPFLAMEWLEGETLGQRLTHGAMGVVAGIALGRRVAAALAAAHQAGIVHRDIKPGNLLLPGGDVDRVKIVDFGVARAGPAITQTGTLLGTPGYVAPEQARGAREVDGRADVFSLGCVLWECLAGRPAFVAEEVMGLLAKILLDDVPRLREACGEAPERLESLIARMLAKEPEHRPADAAEVATELAEIADDLHRGAREDSGLLRRPPPPRVLTRNEQRVLSVLVARPRTATPPEVDHAQAATLASAEAPPEDDVLRAAVEPLGGRLERLIDGSIIVRIADWGGGGGASDQAALAARCALVLARLLPGAAIAVATGRGVLALRTPVGEVIDRAVRLVTHAAGNVVVDDETAGLLGGRYELGGSGAALVLVGPREAEAARTVLGRTVPCVGRDRELRALKSTFTEVLGESVARSVLITSPPGVGKSRLRQEFVRWVREEHPACELIFGRGESVGAGAPFGLLAPALRRMSGVVDGEPLELQRRKLRARLSRHLPQTAGPVSELLGELAGIPFPDERNEILRAARRDPKRMGDELREAWEAWLAAETAEQPLLLVLEDLHWGDLPSVLLVDDALRLLADRPILVLAVARPEVHQQFPQLWAGRGFDEIRLGPLTRKAAERVVAEILPDLPHEVAQWAIDLADGNAFYLEELCRHVAASEQPNQNRQGRAPTTVLGMVQARLDGLGDEAKRVLRAASVFGERFWRGGVARLLGERTQGLPELLEDLAQREVIVRRVGGAQAGEREYAFGHALLREAAYAMLTDADRVLGHRLAGHWLDERSPATGVSWVDAATLAEHFHLGREPQHAGRWFRRAAEQALEGSDLATAIAHAERGLASGASGAVAGGLSLVLAESFLWQGDHRQALRAAMAAGDSLPVTEPDWFRAATQVIEAAALSGDVPRARSWARRVCTNDVDDSGLRISCLARGAKVLLYAGRVRLADELLDELDRAVGRSHEVEHEVRGHVHELTALRAFYRGSLALHLEELEAAYACFQLADDSRGAGQTLAHLGFGLVEVGAWRRAEEVLRESMSWAGRLGFGHVLGSAWKNLARVRLQAGRVDEASELAARAIGVFRTARVPRMEGASLRMLAEAQLAARRLDEALSYALDATDVLVPAPPKRIGAFGTLARVHLARGEVAEALAAARAGIQLFETIGVADEGRILAQVAMIDALFATGDEEAARTRARTLAADLRVQADSISDVELRLAFLTAVPEHVAALERATR